MYLDKLYKVFIKSWCSKEHSLQFLYHTHHQNFFCAFSSSLQVFFWPKVLLLRIRRKVNSPPLRINAKIENIYLSTRKLCVLFGSLKRNRSAEFKVNTSSNSINHRAPTIPFGDDISQFRKKYVFAIKIAEADPRRTNNGWSCPKNIPGIPNKFSPLRG